MTGKLKSFVFLLFTSPPTLTGLISTFPVHLIPPLMFGTNSNGSVSPAWSKHHRLSEFAPKSSTMVPSSVQLVVVLVS